ncbi:unnamed protein product (macronuclear) [Paramecium tetraurelia]|uniref:Beta/gamma crystallin 'Greek key' domain-containing protein n=1 Tax=Paramecium tetraurelia TaxID=5888 RepID=A0C4X9_PARTE|nr:uncharacterized protein GSPATT00006345001 [Paramecium tetraurelia]CAK65846.1 unnamed protein product [Paramecium tetraurelia]|eukprot:XP_001433243.1 hypothetical protein (macronuclear) [Paramecium tetraurelia strain d4-2]
MKRVIILIGFICLFFCNANEDDDLLLGLEIMKEEDAINIKYKPQIFAENKLNTKSQQSSKGHQEQESKSDKGEDQNSNEKSDQKGKSDEEEQQQRDEQKSKSSKSDDGDQNDNSKGTKDEEKSQNENKNKQQNNHMSQDDNETENESKKNKNSNKNNSEDNDDENKGEDSNVVYDNQEGAGGEDEQQFEEVNWDEGGEDGGEGNQNQDEQYQDEQGEKIIENLSDEDLGKVVRELLRGDGYRGEYLFEDDTKSTKPKKANLEQNVDDVCFYAYEECNYQGRAIRLCGRFPTIPPQLSRMTVRSIQIPRHTRIEFYSSPDFKGEMQSFIGSNRCLINPFTINNLSGGIFAY